MPRRNDGGCAVVNGLEKFREKFEKFNEEYAVIGGTACSILMEDAGLEFRTTKDVDMVLIIDARRYTEFGKAFWDFIKEGQYTCGEQASFYSRRCVKFVGDYS